MKKIIIIAAIIISSAVTAFCVTKNNDNKTETAKLKIEASDFAVKTTTAVSSGLATAD